VMVNNGKFDYLGKAGEFVQYISTGDNKVRNRKFFVKGGEKLKFEYDKADGVWNIKGSALNNDYSKIDRQVESYRKQQDSLLAIHGRRLSALSEEERATLTRETRSSIKNIRRAINDLTEDYIRTHPKSPLSIVLLWEYHLNNWRGLTDLYDGLSPASKTIPLADEVKKIVEQKRISTPGNEVPFFTAKDINGNDFSLDLLKGKYVYIDFWATWCGPCLLELPHIKEMWEKMNPENFAIVMISHDYREQDWHDCIEKRGMKEWIHIHDKDRSIANKLGIGGIPASFLIDKQGRYLQRGFSGEGGNLTEEVQHYLK